MKWIRSTLSYVSYDEDGDQNEETCANRSGSPTDKGNKSAFGQNFHLVHLLKRRLPVEGGEPVLAGLYCCGLIVISSYPRRCPRGQRAFPDPR